MVKRAELVHEEFNCHRTNEHTTAQGRGSKGEDGRKAIMRNFIIFSVHNILLGL